MSDTSLGFIFTLLEIVIDFFSDFANSLFTPLWEYLQNGSSDFSEWLLEALDFVGLDVFLSEFTVSGFLFSVTLAVIIIIKFFL